MQTRGTLQTWVLGFLIRENNGKAPCLCSFGIRSEFPISRLSLCQMQILIYPLEVAVRHTQTRLPCWAGKPEPHGLLCRVTCRLQGRKISSVTPGVWTCCPQGHCLPLQKSNEDTANQRIFSPNCTIGLFNWSPAAPPSPHHHHQMYHPLPPPSPR